MDDLEHLIAKTVDPTRADYAVISGVQVRPLLQGHASFAILLSIALLGLARRSPAHSIQSWEVGQ